VQSNITKSQPSSESKKRKAEKSVEASPSIKAPRLEESTPSAQKKDSAKRSSSKSLETKKKKPPTSLDSIILTKERPKATPLSSLPVIPPVDEAKHLGLKGHPYVDVNQALKGANALHTHLKKVAKESGKKSLFEVEDTIYLIVTLNKVPDKRKIRPTRLPLPHSLYGDDCEICILVKDPQKKYREEFAKKKLPNVKKVIGVTKLRENYNQFESRRQLLRSYDLFLCDDKVTLLMTGLLGKPFMKSKKMPIAIRIEDKQDLAHEIVKARDSTYLHIPSGTTANIRIAMTTHSVKEIVENVMSVIDGVASSFALGWNSIRALSLKTSESVALPIYNKLPLLTLPKEKKASTTTTKDAKTSESEKTPVKKLDKGNLSDRTEKTTARQHSDKKKPSTPKKLLH